MNLLHTSRQWWTLSETPHSQKPVSLLGGGIPSDCIDLTVSTKFKVQAPLQIALINITLDIKFEYIFMNSWMRFLKRLLVLKGTEWIREDSGMKRLVVLK